MKSRLWTPDIPGREWDRPVTLNVGGNFFLPEGEIFLYPFELWDFNRCVPNLVPLLEERPNIPSSSLPCFDIREESFLFCIPHFLASGQSLSLSFPSSLFLSPFLLLSFSLLSFFSLYFFFFFSLSFLSFISFSLLSLSHTRTCPQSTCLSYCLSWCLRSSLLPRVKGLNMVRLMDEIIICGFVFTASVRPVRPSLRPSENVKIKTVN